MTVRLWPTLSKQTVSVRIHIVRPLFVIGQRVFYYMTLRDTINKDLARISLDLGSPVMGWNGEEYECIASSQGSTFKLEIGGYAEDSDVVFTLRKELFADGIYPISKQKVTFDGLTYRIENVKYDVTKAIIRLFCNNINNGV